MLRWFQTTTPTTGTFTIPVQSLSAGTQNANAFSGWASPATNVFVQTANGLTNGKWLSVNPNSSFIAKTSGKSRDQEITFFASIGSVYLRLTDDGTALVFEVNDYGNTYNVYLADNIQEGPTSSVVGPKRTYTTDQFITALPAIGDVPGRTYPVTSQKLWTFGVSGFDVYLKYDGVEFWRSRQFWHLAPGRIALGGHPTYDSFGFSSVSATLSADATLYSNTYSKVFDVRDFDIRAVTPTTGTIGAGSTSLVVADATDFSIGDTVCIATGGEAGGGVPGEQGVGGSWPTLKYATTTAMNADTSQPTGKVCGVLANGNSYQWDGSAWVAYTGAAAIYLQKILPKALVATISGKSGNTLTLDTSSVAAATNAAVYLDNSDAMAASFTASNSGLGRQVGCTIKFQPGYYVFAGATVTISNVSGLNILGSGVDRTHIVSPTGIAETYLTATTCPSGSFKKMTLVGNTRADKGYMFRYHATYDYWAGAAELFRVNTSDDFVVEDTKGINHSVAIATQNFCNRPIIRRVQCVHETGHLSYFQWAVNIADSNYGIAEDIDFDFAMLTCGMETFRSIGTTIRRLSGRNVKLSSNSAGSFTFADSSLTWEANCGDLPGMTALPMNQRFPSPYEPMLNLNSNIDNQSGTETPTGGTVSNFDMTVQGRIFTGDIGAYMIAVSGTVDNVTISGQYPAKPVTAPSGLITLPDCGADFCMAVRVDANDKTILVDGIRVNTGSAMPPVGGNNGYFKPTLMTVQNSVIDDEPPTGSGTWTSNITNAAYEAL